METIKQVKASKFRFEKLYLDLIDNYGNCFIIYRAEIKFLFLRFHYSSILYSNPCGIAFEKTTYKKTEKPHIKDLVIFHNNILNFRGNWKLTTSPIPPMTLTGDLNHNLVWNCHHPCALSEVFYNNNKYEGLGYAETIAFTMNPASFPFTEIRWGRFLSDKYVIIWLNWKGSKPLNKIFINGSEYSDAIIGEEKITFGDRAFTIVFEKISAIRKGKLSDTLSKQPWLRILPGSRILNSVETKYKAKTTLMMNNGHEASGWSLYETVIWNE